MCNIQFVCHANKQKSLSYFFSKNVSQNIALPFTLSLNKHKHAPVSYCLIDTVYWFIVSHSDNFEFF